MLICFTYKQFFIKWFHWMTQFCSENIFFVLKQFNTAFIQAPMGYSANIITSLFYLLKQIFNLVTSFIFLIPLFLISLCLSRFSWYLFLGYSFCFPGFFLAPCFLMFYFTSWVFWEPCFLIISFYSLDFHSIYIV